MQSALLWFLLIFAIIVVVKLVREHMRNDQGLRAWYERMMKDRIELIKKIAIFGTLILWVGIWLVTRGEEKAGIGSLLKDFSSSWTKQEDQSPPSINKE
jgi:hypothetical protein